MPGGQWEVTAGVFAKEVGGDRYQGGVTANVD
jgi:hypothetical protein